MEGSLGLPGVTTGGTTAGLRAPRLESALPLGGNGLEAAFGLAGIDSGGGRRVDLTAPGLLADGVFLAGRRAGRETSRAAGLAADFFAAGFFMAARAEQQTDGQPS